MTGDKIIFANFALLRNSCSLLAILEIKTFFADLWGGNTCSTLSVNKQNVRRIPQKYRIDRPTKNPTVTSIHYKSTQCRFQLGWSLRQSKRKAERVAILVLLSQLSTTNPHTTFLLVTWRDRTDVRPFSWANWWHFIFEKRQSWSASSGKVESVGFRSWFALS